MFYLFNLQGAQLLTAAKGLSNLKVTQRKGRLEKEIVVSFSLEMFKTRKREYTF